MTEKGNDSILMGRGDPLPLTMLIAFFQSFALGYVTLGMVYYAADRFHADSATVGILASVYTATYALSCLVLNKPISRLKPYQAVTAAVIIQGILSQLLIRVNSLNLMAALYFLFGLSTGLLWPPVMGWMARGRDGNRLNRTMSAYNFSWSIPWMLSPYITGLLYEQSRFLPFHVCTVFSLIVFLIIRIYLLIRPEVRESAESEHTIKKASQKGKDQSTPLRFLSWISLFPGYFLMGLFGSIFPIFLRRAFTLPESEVGLVILVRAAVTLIIFYIMGKTSWWHFKKKQLLLSTLIFSLILAGFSVSHALWHYVLWTVLSGLIIGVTYTNSMFHCLSGTIERQKRMNIHETVLTAAMLAGSFLGGMFLDRYGMNFIILFSAGIMGAAFLVQIVTDQYSKRERIASDSL